MKSKKNSSESKKHRQQLLSVALIILVAFFVFLSVAAGQRDNYQDRTLSYQDSLEKITFNYPSKFSINDASHSNEKIRIIEVSPKIRAASQYGSEFIEIFSYPADKSKTAKEVAQDFLQSDRSDEFSYLGRKDIDSVWYVQTSGLGEQSYYSFFKKDNRAIVAIFRSRHFDKSNPLVMIDNTSYLQDYMEIINTLNFFQD